MALRPRLLILGAWAALAAANPFSTHSFYLNPVNRALYTESISSAASPAVRSNLEKMRDIASAYWIDRKEKIRGNTTRSVRGILADASARSPSELVVLIWYDFPNRDCAAAASAGEICCAYNPDRTCNWDAGGDCASGLQEYKMGYVEPFVEVLEEFKARVPVVIIFEPDSLPNFATNLDKPHCGSLATRRAYTEGARYALTQLTSRTDASVYIDAAHGGWLGWHDNLLKYIAILKELQVPFDKIRGFSTNVAAYQPLGTMCPWQPDDPAKSPYRNGFCLNGRNRNHACCVDACGLLEQWDPAQHELNYAQELHKAAKVELNMDARIIIDTGRNGVPDARSDCSSWCNNRGAGAGHASAAASPELAGILDAFFYLKTPGESDGCSAILPDGQSCPRFDVACGARDAIGSSPGEPRAPEAGVWFDYQVKQLAEFADFGDDKLFSAPVPPGAAPARPAPAPAPLTRAQTPAPPAGGSGSKCCWGSSCDAAYTCAAGWCSQSQDACTGSCGGIWCPAAPVASLTSTEASASRKAVLGRSRRLRARSLEPSADHVMLQRLSALTETEELVQDELVQDEL